jgi:hypothetical protein
MITRNLSKISPIWIKYLANVNIYFPCLGQYLIKSLHRLFIAHILSRKQIQLIDNVKNINDIVYHLFIFLLNQYDSSTYKQLIISYTNCFNKMVGKSLRITFFFLLILFDDEDVPLFFLFLLD